MVHFDFHIFGLAQCDRRVFSCSYRVVARVSVPVPVCVCAQFFFAAFAIVCFKPQWQLCCNNTPNTKRCSVTYKYNLQSAVLQWARGKGISHKLSVDEICNVNILGSAESSLDRVTLPAVFVVAGLVQGVFWAPNGAFSQLLSQRRLPTAATPTRTVSLRRPACPTLRLWFFGREPTSCKQGTNVSNGTRLRHDAKKNK